MTDVIYTYRLKMYCDIIFLGTLVHWALVYNVHELNRMKVITAN